MLLNTITAARKIVLLVKKEPFFVITLLLTVSFSIFSKPHISSVHWNVIATLFSLMLICHAFDQCRLLTSLAGKVLCTFKTPRKLGFAMIFATGVFAMFVTNDVALLTVVPLTMQMAKVSKKDPYLLIILETMAANLFSALTPFGNPQNLFLYSYFHIPVSGFFKIMIPFCLISGLLLVLINLVFNTGNAYKVEARKFELFDSRLLIGASAAFLLNILSVFRMIDYWISLAATLLIVIFFAPRLLLKVDYILLMTFVLFFLFTDSVTGIPMIKTFFAGLLNSKLSVLLASAGLSQIISNVPAAVLISGFTMHYRELLYGVSAGGLGTLVASLASLISYKLYIHEYKSARYIRIFSLMNFGVLFILIAVIILIGKQ